MYAGIFYIVAEKEGKRYIGFEPADVAQMSQMGADLTLLNDIGDQDPDDVMATLFDSIPKK